MRPAGDIWAEAAPALTWDQHAHVYQRAGCEHLVARNVATLFLAPGYGKTAITLHAFKRLADAGQARHMLVVAPLRVAQTVWAQEIERWVSLNGLRACLLHGTKKEKWLKRRDVNVWLINYEGLQWLRQMFDKRKVETPFDVIVFDEIRRMKESTGMRFKAVKPIAAMARFRWGLTGTPVSNGLMDLFGQFLILDGGAALGSRITRFRLEFFEKGFDGFTWLPRPGAQEAIEARIRDYVFRADGLLDLPEFVYDNRRIVLDDKARAAYDRMKQVMVSSLEGTTITAANAAVVVGKLKQMSNGRVYDEDRNVVHVHKAKQDALRELVEEMGDEQLLIAYDYHHDLEQIREVLGHDIPYLGAGVTSKQATENVDRWNAREIQFMAANPASAGHGLNLQKGGACHILWWGPTFDLDHYVQFNDRLRRQGNVASTVFVHTFVTERSVDEVAMKARVEKATVQDALLAALTSVTGDNMIIDTPMNPEESVMELQFKSDAQMQQGQPQANPFMQPPAQPNPFAAAPQGQPQANPFAQAASAQNPFAQQPAPTQANPFAQATPSPQQMAQQVAQQQAIQQDVAAAPPPSPEQMFAQAGFPIAGTASAPPNPFTPVHQPIEDAVVVQETPAAPQSAPPVAQEPAQATTPAQNPFAAVTPAPAPVGDPAPTNVMPVAADTLTNVVAQSTDAASQVPGMVPLYMLVPAEKMASVMAALGRALK